MRVHRNPNAPHRMGLHRGGVSDWQFIMVVCRVRVGWQCIMVYGEHVG
jgi:hypothetical protein